MSSRFPGAIVWFLGVAALAVTAGSSASSAREASGPHPSSLRAAAPASGDFIAEVVGPYLTIQDALVKDELAPVAAAAASLHKGASGLGADGADIVAAASRAREAKSLEAARAAFGDLSAALIAYADRSKLPIDGKVVAFCPMANKAWVQTDGAVANPYYGKSMATCGSVQRKLSAPR